MALKIKNPTHTGAWKKLEKHYEEMENLHMQTLFSSDKSRAEEYSILWNGFLVDYSKNIINAETLTLLRELAVEMELPDAIEKYFSGDVINQTEKRAVLHTALRSQRGNEVFADGQNIIPEVIQVREKIKNFTDEVVNGKRTGFSGKQFTDIVNIGIGGSDLGPAMAVEALKFYSNHLSIHFVSNVDGDHVRETIKKINPETTLFVIVSKTFTTQETLSNAETIRKWFLESASPKDIASHFVAVSTNIQKVTEFGIDPENIFPMWDWVGGRFSLWSAVGLTISLSVGSENFEQLLSGATEMDVHFRKSEIECNIPVTLALLTIWYNNFFEAQSHAIIAYSQYLEKFAPYLQQGIMESNGKSVGRDGKPVDYQTGNIIWGEPGTNSQHAFFQLIHQGTKLIPADFIGFIKPLYDDRVHHDKLMSNFFAQTEALLHGKTPQQVKDEYISQGIPEEQYAFLVPFKTFSGNRPTNTILIDKLTPASLGSLIAMYEHKIFVEGLIWNIFSFDQWGVELGKQLATNILTEIQNGSAGDHDSSTLALLKYYIVNKEC